MNVPTNSLQNIPFNSMIKNMAIVRIVYIKSEKFRESLFNLDR
jgi:hypothetical protein